MLEFVDASEFITMKKDQFENSFGNLMKVFAPKIDDVIPLTVIFFSFIIDFCNRVKILRLRKLTLICI